MRKKIEAIDNDDTLMISIDAADKASIRENHWSNRIIQSLEQQVNVGVKI